jgi:hypothetical protein
MAGPKYYHMSASKLKIGCELKPKGGAHVSEEVEEILARRRPDGSIARSNAVYLSETEKVSQFGLKYDRGYMHTVEPNGVVQKRDTKWVSELQMRHHANARIARLADQKLADFSDEDIADKYYAGEASSNPVWEFLAEGAIVEAVSERPTQIRDKNADLLAKVISADKQRKKND